MAHEAGRPDGVPDLVDDEAERPAVVFLYGDEEAPLIDPFAALAAPGGDDLGEALSKLRPDSCDHDPIVGAGAFEDLPVALTGLPGEELAAMNPFPGLGSMVPDRDLSSSA